jgi:addiction module HigA family antidote
MILSFACADTEATLPKPGHCPVSEHRAGGTAQAAATARGYRTDDVSGFLRATSLEALKGDRKGQHSIRVNDQWRVCFVWRDDGAQRSRDCRLSLGVEDMAKLLDEIHPGEILLEDFMKPMGISARQLAADIDVSPSRISELVHGIRPITADTATSPGAVFWNVAALLAEPANRV